MALAGRLVANLAKTAPVFPWLLEILPQMVLNLFSALPEWVL
jgi:hypothetical protein